MRNIMVAIAATFATLAPLATAAEQPTAELRAKMDGLSTEIAALAATVANLAGAVGTSSASIASKVDALSSTVAANHTTIVGKFAPQMAVVMSVPPQRSVSAGIASESVSTSGGSGVPHYLVGESTIPGFPAGAVGTNGLFTDRTLPAGTYLFELQQPYGDNAICQRELSRRFLLRGGNGKRRNNVCPRVRLHPFSNSTRLEDGYGIYTYAAPASFRLDHYWPAGLKFSEDTSLSAAERARASSIASYTGAIKITKLK